MIPRSVQQGVMVTPHGAYDNVLITHSTKETVLEIPRYVPFFYVS